MKGKIAGIIASGLMVSLGLVSCSTSPATNSGPAQGQQSTAAQQNAQTTAPQQAAKTEAKPAAQAPQYGGTLHLGISADVTTWDDATQGGPGGWDSLLTNQELWGGDWTKGPAGGNGTKDTDWGNTGYDTFKNKTGYIAESWQINVDAQNQQATVVYKIRPGIHWATNPNSPTSVQVGGRELTADDVLASMKQATTDSKAYVYRSNAELRNIDISKTGPMEITVKTPVANLVTALSRFGDALRIYPAEVRDKMADWKNRVGTGPFVLTDYVAGSTVTFQKNVNYWMKDPIGPGKGNQLPYLDGIQLFVIPDLSTRLAAFRTGKIEEIDGLTWEDANQIKKESPQMPQAQGGYYNIFPMFMRTDKAPLNDVRVRRALMMGTDFNTIKDSFNGGLGTIITFPYEYYPDYADLYLGLDDPWIPASVKELYTYNPDKAKQLLAEAGLPNGFKTSIMCMADEASYFEMISSMWAKIGVTLAIDVKDAPTRSKILDSQAWDGMSTSGKGPVAIYYTSPQLQGVSSSAINNSYINDPYINETLAKVRLLAATNEKDALALTKEMTKHVLDQAYAIPRPSYRSFTFWWPWLKNYSGEISVGYFDYFNWTQFVWLDQSLKQSMGH